MYIDVKLLHTTQYSALTVQRDAAVSLAAGVLGHAGVLPEVRLPSSLDCQLHLDLGTQSTHSPQQTLDSTA